MGRELSEDRFHKLERQLALAKGFAEDMQAAFQECEDHASALDEEAEKIQEEVGLDIDLLQCFERHLRPQITRVQVDSCLQFLGPQVYLLLKTFMCIGKLMALSLHHPACTMWL